MQSVYPRMSTVQNNSSTTLSLDEAYLIVRNTNYSNTIALFGNKLICEDCNLEKMIVVKPIQNSTMIINTKYGYNFELRLWPSNVSLSCKIASYKFAEHGTYILAIMEVKQDTCLYSIEQIGNPSHYWTPVIIGILFVVFYTILAQIWHHVYHRHYFSHHHSDDSRKQFINNNLKANVSASTINIEQKVINETNEDINSPTTNTSALPLPGSTSVSGDSTRMKKALPKRLRALDTFRGFSLMVMIFVNYGDILGILTGILLCYLGVQAGHCFIYSTRVLRICGHWLVLGIICGSIALILSRGGHSNSLIPINKNLWSLTFVLMLASLAFIILTILYFLIDVNQ
ncbi:unnamed protein product [Rotaria sp. Silwood2]|nr:unnamed protein product [Rotaria sp. Silwood2]CAF4007397.1 unnamed protein product [Rotaria sp. Silwood2]